MNRLIRIKYGPFELSELASGTLEEVPAEQLTRILGEEIRTQRMSQAPERPQRGQRPNGSRGGPRSGGPPGRRPGGQKKRPPRR